jgi:hypothetical protein
MELTASTFESLSKAQFTSKSTNKTPLSILGLCMGAKLLIWTGDPRQQIQAGQVKRPSRGRASDNIRKSVNELFSVSSQGQLAERIKHDRPEADNLSIHPWSILRNF